MRLSRANRKSSATLTRWCSLRHTKPMLSMVILLSLAGASDRVATESETNAAYSAYFSCFDEFAPKYDDGRSDAQTIALAIIPLCAPQRDALADVMNKGKPKRYLPLAKQVIDRQALSVATAAVLVARKDNAESRGK